eukprot:Blabericola_migrator_1__2533@NODE_1713_length_3941_cov_112_399845_g1108_i0_p4_GENE_NODE_1713_length_3941_cov_112_399845_g1108_i0NODE_1713_length_3941_cov_112_399845_g1108_i0_p4_ORF_typecomplete_len152_score31_45_NODE_1713_length_3941_cov_112_399845_g1108_i022002655
MTAPMESQEDANLTLLKTALQETLFYNPLKRYLYKEELRLQKLHDSILESMPSTLLNMKIGDLIDTCQGTKGENPEDSGKNGLTELEIALELLSWVRQFVPCPGEQEDPLLKADRVYMDCLENVPPPKRARIESAGVSESGRATHSTDKPN